MKLTFGTESWPLEQRFIMATGKVDVVELVVVSIRNGSFYGRGECQPRESAGLVVSKVVAQIESVRQRIEDGASRTDLLTLLPPGPARNAIDCALWDLEAKMKNSTVQEISKLPRAESVTTDYTISLDAPEAMAKQAAQYSDWPLLKLNLSGDERDIERVSVVRDVCPNSQLIVDLNGQWSIERLVELAPVMQQLGVSMIEQPLAANKDAALDDVSIDIPLCADESCTDINDLPELAKRYQYIRISLDQVGGLTAAITLTKAAQGLSLGTVVGASIGTSLSIAPATILGGITEFADLDGALLLASDRRNAIRYEKWRLSPPDPQLWG